MRRDPHRATLASSDAGFTLLEMVIVMGLLSGFLLMLSQLMTTGITIFDEGETGQALGDRCQAAARKVEAVLEDLTGPAFVDPEPRDPDGRLLVQPVPLGFAPPEKGEAGAPTVGMLRAEVVLSKALERSLREPQLRADLGDELPLDPGEADAVVAGLLDQEPVLGRGRMWLLPWPQGDAEGAYLQLRRGRFILGNPIDLRSGLQDGEEEWVDPRDLADPTEVAAPAMEALTEIVVEDLLHFEIQLWSQYTASWDAVGDTGPEVSWDSARAGLLTDLDSGWDFGLDLGEWSYRDPVDDVFPRAVRLVLVVGQSPNVRPEAALASPLTADDDVARLISGEDLVVDDGGMVKIGAEWVRVGSVDGQYLRGLKRAQRGTVKAGHDAGAGVRAGRTVVLDVAIPFGKDSWNG